MTRSIARFFALNLMSAALLALACAGLWASSATAQSTDKVVIGVAASPETMNPHGSDADSNMSIISNVFEGLVQRNSKGELEPALATSWKRINPLTWRFHLRKGVKFHNGNPFTWEDVKFSFKHLSNPEVSAFLAFGALVDSITTVNGNPWVIDIKTKYPVPFFVQNLHQTFIMDKESTVSRSQGEVGQKPIGTGAYRLVEWVKGSYLKFKANENYWGANRRSRRWWFDR